MSAEADVKLQDFENIFKLDGKVAVVTGGSRGLGLHAASGYVTTHLPPPTRNPHKPNPPTSLLQADLSQMSEIERLASEISKITPHIDILLANAGATWGERFETHPAPTFSKVMDLNVKSVFYMIQKLETLLKKRATLERPGTRHRHRLDRGDRHRHARRQRYLLLLGVQSRRDPSHQEPGG